MSLHVTKHPKNRLGWRGNTHGCDNRGNWRAKPEHCPPAVTEQPREGQALPPSARVEKIRQAQRNVKARAIDPFEADLRRGEIAVAQTDRDSQNELAALLAEQEGL